MSKQLKKFEENKLKTGEIIIKSLDGYIGKPMGKGSDEQFNGVLILTDQRVVFYSKTWLNEVMRSMDITNIDTVDTSSGLLSMSRIKMISTSATLDFAGVNKNEISDFRDELEKLRNKVKNSESEGSSNDIPSQIKKLSELKESGILTEDEFNTKKAELLAKM